MGMVIRGWREIDERFVSGERERIVVRVVSCETGGHGEEANGRQTDGTTLLLDL